MKVNKKIKITIGIFLILFLLIVIIYFFGFFNKEREGSKEIIEEETINDRLMKMVPETRLTEEEKKEIEDKLTIETKKVRPLTEKEKKEIEDELIKK